MTLLDAVGWVIVAGLVAFIGYRVLKRSGFIDIETDGIRTRGLMTWSDQEHYLFADIRRFEERYSRPPFARQGSWRLYAVIVEGGQERRCELPNFSGTSFSTLKRALTDWQTAHGCLQPLPLADMSNTVRY
jgi:hypothetical protein